MRLAMLSTKTKLDRKMRNLPSIRFVCMPCDIIMCRTRAISILNARKPAGDPGHDTKRQNGKLISRFTLRMNL